MVQQNTTTAPQHEHETTYSLGQDVYHIENEKGLERHKCENDDGQQEKCMRVLKDGSRRSSRCKPGDWNFGGVAIAARKRASGVWEEEKSVVGESPPIADAFAAPPRDHIREQKKDEEVRGWEGVTPAVLLTCVFVVRSVACCSPRRLLAPGPPVAEVAAFELHADDAKERSVGLRPTEKGMGVCCCRRSPSLAPLAGPGPPPPPPRCCSAGLLEPNIIAVLRVQG